MHTFDLRMQEAEPGISVYFRPTWSGVLRHSEVYRETLSQKIKIEREKNMTDKLGVVAKVCGPMIRKAQAGVLLQVHGDPGLHRMFSSLSEK